MGDKINNVKGEQGGIFLTDGQTWTASGQKEYATGFFTWSNTVLADITLDGFGGTESLVATAAVDAGQYRPGLISAIEVGTGTIQLLFGVEQ